MIRIRITEHPILEAAAGKHVSFTFNGQIMFGLEGEMVSSALFANGIRSFSIHTVGDGPQGIFCANGQCAQCTVVINGRPQKSCVTPLTEGMKIETLVHLPELPADDLPRTSHTPKELTCDVLVVGGGPSGITAAIELSDQGLSVILVDDKAKLGGKLILQTHKFFGSMEDCYAGTRGTKIGESLEKEIKSRERIRIMTNSTVAAIFSDGKAGVYEDNRHYTHITFQGLIVAAGARERSLIFPGNDLPGVFGAGAFQTLVNRDLVKASQRVLIVGCGNVGLIGAYHALQARIEVVGIIDIAASISGYKVHVDKIKRMGVPIYLEHTLLCAEGDGRVERATIAQIDKNFNPLLETAKTFEVDTVLIAVGLTPVDEFYTAAVEGGFPVLKTGDAHEIAEASSAMMGGKITGRKMAQLLGKDISIPPEWHEKAEILKSQPGSVNKRENPKLDRNGYRPVFHCYQEIPCNPCTSICPYDSIHLSGKTGTIMDLPEFDGKCMGCGLCVLICPGLAITLVRPSPKSGLAEVVLPHEFHHSYQPGDHLPIRDSEGLPLGTGVVIESRFNRKHRTYLITVEVPEEIRTQAAGILVQAEAVTAPLAKPSFSYLPKNAVVCRCERISVGEIIQFVQENRVEDINQLKTIRVGMGACGGKTCSELLPRVLIQAGVKKEAVIPATQRPLTVEVPMGTIANQE